MKSKKVFLIAAAILVACTGIFVASTQIALGAQGSMPVSQQSTYNAAAQEPAPADTVEIDSEGSATVSASPPVFITAEDAIGATMWVAENLFELDVDEDTLIATFEAAHDLLDENGNAYSHVYDNWQVQNTDFSCLLDAITGDVLMFNVSTDDYPGESITEGDFDMDLATTIYDDPDNIYVTAARAIVEAELSEGREIEGIEVDGIQFVWDEPSTGPDPDATGTIQVDCHVYMESGRHYTLSFWGTDEIVLKKFSTYPTVEACQWGYFYENDLPVSGPQPSCDTWNAAPGITQGEYAEEGKS